LRRTILVGGGNFAERQLYCRICASVALALHLGSQSVSSSKMETKDDPVTTVGLTLIQVLRVMTLGVQKLTHFQTVMNELED